MFSPEERERIYQKSLEQGCNMPYMFAMTRAEWDQVTLEDLDALAAMAAGELTDDAFLRSLHISPE